MPRKVEKTRAGGTKTEKGYLGHIVSVLRAGTKRWGPKWTVMNDGRVKRLNPQSGKEAFGNTCQVCNEWFFMKDLKADHIENVGRYLDRTDINTFMSTLGKYAVAMFCEAEGLQRICIECHTNIKTPEDKETTKKLQGIRKLYPYEESSYRNMLSRCNNPNATGYKYYGGRGIKVCQRWQDDFYNFLHDMGRRPDRHSLDRLDYDGDYTKENCRWATWQEQARNTTRNHVISYRGVSKSVCEWSEELNIKSNTIIYRLRRGWPVAEALEKEDRICPYAIKFEETGESYRGRLTEEDIAVIEKEISKGTSQADLAERFQIDNSNISRLLTKMGIEQPEKPNKLKENVFKLLKQGLTAAVIAKQLQCSLSSVHTYKRLFKKIERRTEE